MECVLTPYKMSKLKYLNCFPLLYEAPSPRSFYFSERYVQFDNRIWRSELLVFTFCHADGAMGETVWQT